MPTLLKISKNNKNSAKSSVMACQPLSMGDRQQMYTHRSPTIWLHANLMPSLCTLMATTSNQLLIPLITHAQLVACVWRVPHAAWFCTNYVARVPSNQITSLTFKTRATTMPCVLMLSHPSMSTQKPEQVRNKHSTSKMHIFIQPSK